MRVTLIDVLMRFSSSLTSHQQDTRRAALLEMSKDHLTLEAILFCGGAPWREWERVQATRAAFDALPDTP